LKARQAREALIKRIRQAEEDMKARQAKAALKKKLGDEARMKARLARAALIARINKEEAGLQLLLKKAQ